MNKKMIVTSVTNDISVMFLEGHFERAQEAGFNTMLICSSGPNSSEISKKENTRFNEVGFSREISVFNDFGCLLKLVMLFLKEKPFVVNAGTPKASLLCMIAAWVTGVPHRIYTQHGFRHESLHGFSRKLQISMEKITSFFATQVICVSPSVRDLGISLGFFSEGKSHVLGSGSCGVSLDKLLDDVGLSSSRENLKEKLGMKEGDFVIGFVGRVIPRKGVEDLISVFSEISQVRKNVKLLLVGGFEDAQPVSDWCLKKIEKDENIINVGHQPNVASYMRTMDIFAMPSHWEGFGNTLVEAAYLGLPVITSDGTGSRDAVKNGYNGVIVPVGDKRALKKIITDYIESPELVKLHGANGPGWAKRFDRNIINDELISFYKALS